MTFSVPVILVDAVNYYELDRARIFAVDPCVLNRFLQQLSGGRHRRRCALLLNLVASMLPVQLLGAPDWLEATITFGVVVRHNERNLELVHARMH
jgi:hypothetical protein